ncbi:hypothetical protein GCM10009647_044980 [Streptomyces sanglieri]
MQAVERQTAALRELSRRAFPEPSAVPDDAPAPIEQARAQCRHQTAATEAAALRRARAEKDGHQLQRLERTARTAMAVVPFPGFRFEQAGRSGLANDQL